MCRELISDFDPEIAVLYPDQGRVCKCAVADLLPFKYARG